MRFKKNHFIITLFIIFFACACSAPPPYKIKMVDTVESLNSYKLNVSEVENGKKYRVSGLLRLIGPANFTQLVLTNGEKLTLYIKSDATTLKLLKQLQYRFVEIEGVITHFQMLLADKKTQFDRYTIAPDKITKIKEKKQRL